MDFSGGSGVPRRRWFTFDARHNTRGSAECSWRGRDAVDVAITTSFGPTLFEKFVVYTDEVPERPGGRDDVGQDFPILSGHTEKYDRIGILSYDTSCDVNSDVDRGGRRRGSRL